ncbi:urease accessory protein UreD [Zhihengliuella halotolerans]|uniref:Urease accessory protein UreD n=1 Tax=Zhihengliuella halotolerans TaxID=370736 RepID=A0A4Q8ADM9_9MICC|nr:urease accessory protein UreD [Zhihengliuella halotolerans]RZU62244.1 urease accessory protein [Zhihengliuella halotolerans]
MGLQREAPERLTGELRVAAHRVPGSERTEIGRQYHAGALRILRPHYAAGSGQAVLTVVNPGGGFLGADRYEIEYDGGPGSSVLLTTQSATKVYRTPQGPACQEQRFTLAPGAVLESVPDPAIAYQDASFVQDTEVDLADATSHFFGAEIVTPGWAADGTCFRYRDVRLRTTVRSGGRLVLLDNLLLRPADAHLTGLGWLEGRTHYASVVIAGAGAGEELLAQVRAICAEYAHDDAPGGAAATTLAAGTPRVLAGSSLTAGAADAAAVLVVRALADGTDVLTELVHRLGTAARQARTGTQAVGWDLRKY